MNYYKIVFEDQDRIKAVWGTADFSDDELVKIKCDDGKEIFVNKTKIIFAREV